jgi:hypothetical protein
VDPASIRRIRLRLELDTRHGVDSAVFYNAGEPLERIDSVISQYRAVLDRLAIYDRQ